MASSVTAPEPKGTVLRGAAAAPPPFISTAEPPPPPLPYQQCCQNEQGRCSGPASVHQHCRTAQQGQADLQ